MSDTALAVWNMVTRWYSGQTIDKESIAEMIVRGCGEHECFTKLVLGTE